MSLGKASIQRAANAGKTTKTTKTAKTTKANTASGTTVDSVITPMNSEEIQVKFLSDKIPDGEENRPVRITDPMPDFLL